ncbi:hypothetical protein [Herbaspirillum huttiense]|uniref:hypothetical protein n=1 Tax=Herbaspirillum huttiense TaxID=863372 RepID=UPI0039B052C4
MNTAQTIAVAPHPYVAPADVLEDQEMRYLQHTLGIARLRAREHWGRRNYFAAGTGNQQEVLGRLEKKGLVQLAYRTTSQAVYQATRKGCEVAGLRGAEIELALSAS